MGLMMRAQARQGIRRTCEFKNGTTGLRLTQSFYPLMSDRPVSEALCDLIREAFAGVKLGNGIGLQEAQGIDDYADKETCARYRAGDEKEDWTRIPAEELSRCNSSLSFFDAEGMRFHLPAFLVAELQG